MIMPAVLGWWLTKFSSHYVGFRYFYGIGGAVGLLANLLFCTNVHPLEEPLDLCCQCTRHRFTGRKEHDFKRRAKRKADDQRRGSSKDDDFGMAGGLDGSIEAEMMSSYTSGGGGYKQGGDLSRPLLRSV